MNLELSINISFFIIFTAMCFISTIVVKDLNLERFFKQGRIGSIRAAYFIIIFLMSFLVAFAVREISLIIISFVK